MIEKHNKSVGVVGLGQMGGPMAAVLAQKGFDVFGYDVDEGAMRAAEAAGVKPLHSDNEIFERCDVTILSLPTQHVMEEVVVGAGGYVECAAAGKVIIDTTTTTASMAESVAARMAAVDCVFLDAPVTGGARGAAAGTLSIMVGGDETAFEDNRDILNALGTTVVHIGRSGHGQVAKMVNQMLMAAIYTSVNEAFSLAVQCGADIGRIYEAVEVGGGRSMLLSGMKSHMLGGVVASGNNLTQHGKDIDYVMDEANRRKIFLPVTSSVHEFYNLARSMGFGGIWSGEMWAVWEKLLGVKFTDTIQKGARAGELTAVR